MEGKVLEVLLGCQREAEETVFLPFESKQTIKTDRIPMRVTRVLTLTHTTILRHLTINTTNSGAEFYSQLMRSFVAK